MLAKFSDYAIHIITDINLLKFYTAKTSKQQEDLSDSVIIRNVSCPIEYGVEDSHKKNQMGAPDAWSTQLRLLAIISQCYMAYHLVVLEFAIMQTLSILRKHSIFLTVGVVMYLYRMFEGKGATIQLPLSICTIFTFVCLLYPNAFICNNIHTCVYMPTFIHIAMHLLH